MQLWICIEIGILTSALLPVLLMPLFWHSVLRSFSLRGKYLEALACELSRLLGRPAWALELMLRRRVCVNLVTGGVILDMFALECVYGIVVEEWMR